MSSLLARIARGIASMERNRKITSWRPLHGVALVGLFALAAIAPAFGSPVARNFVAPAATRPPRVLLMGDSVMDQQGNAAAFLLRQSGVDAKAEGWWGSSLLTTDQYDDGKTKPGGVWLKEATRLVATWNPDVVAVYLNHNYWPPFPHDAAGRTIEDLWSASGQSMIHQQVTALLRILRSRGARVYFVTPIPAGGDNRNPDPNVWNPIWHGYLPVLRSLHVPLIDSGRVLEAANGLRAETKPDCTGAPSRIRPPANLHLTRFGAGIAGTADARAIANGLRLDLNDNAAPGDHTVALVPSPSGGYWLVACDGSIYHFGGAASVPGAHSRVAVHRGGVVGAVATASGGGLWLVTADGSIVNVGDAPHIGFAVRPTARVVGVAPTADHAGLFAVARDGAVATAGDARNFGSVAGRTLNGSVLGIAATPDGKGYWLVGRDGGIFSFGDAHFLGSMGATKLNGPIAALAPAPGGRGYWLVGADGGIFAFGDARYSGNGRWIVPAYPKNLFTPAPGPIVDVVAASGARQGYWTLNDTGRVTNHGAASGHAGDSNLALSTQ